MPGDALMQPCVAPKHVPTRKVRDLTDNLISAQSAWESCAARLQCLIGWLKAAKGDAASVCGLAGEYERLNTFLRPVARNRQKRQTKEKPDK